MAKNTTATFARNWRKKPRKLGGAKGREEVAEELADLFEVADALMAVHELERSLVEEVRLKKREKRGGFDQGIVLLRLPKK